MTEASATAGINDYSRKETDDFGAVTVVQRAWSKRMAANALIRTDAIDLVANRIAAVRARPSMWIGHPGKDSLTIYGFFKEFSIEAGETVSKLSLSIEGLSKAPPLAPVTDTDIGIITERYPRPIPTGPKIGSIYFDAKHHPYRFEGYPIKFSTKKQSDQFGTDDSGGVIMDNGLVWTWRSINVAANAAGTFFAYGDNHQYQTFAHAWLSGGYGSGDAQINNPFVDYTAGGDTLTGAYISQARDQTVPCKLFSIGR